MTTTTVADANFWTLDERAEPAIYVAKLATALDVSGNGLDALLIDRANAYASKRGIPRLRWDVWRSNRELQEYYAKVRGTYLRTALNGVRILDPIGTLAIAERRVAIRVPGGRPMR